MDTQSKYCYPGSDVLINLPGIKDQEQLSRFEDIVSSLRIAELMQQGITGNFNFNHLKEIHRYMFQDVYPFAGQIRQEDIHKGFHFSRHQFIESEGNRLFRELAAENHLKGLEIDQFAKRAAHYMAELNVLHPFREGNGRSLREFMRQLSLNAGYVLDFNQVPQQVFFDASVRSVVDPDPLAKVIRECLRKEESKMSLEWIVPKKPALLKDVLKIPNGLPAKSAGIDSKMLNRNVEKFMIENRSGTVHVKLQGENDIRKIPIERHPYLTPARRSQILEMASKAPKTNQIDRFLER